MSILIGIPAYNEEMTIAGVIERTRQALPTHDIVVVNDGSSDRTAAIIRDCPAALVSLPCNLGYGYAVETLLRYAIKHSYEAIALIDADGQHDPAALPGFLDAFRQKGCDMLIGSRYIESSMYKDAPFGRRIGMVVFSRLTHLLTGKRVYDTTSGMKVINRRAMQAMLNWHFIDFHAEAITYLLWLGFTIDEYPISVKEREHGVSMYSFFSHLWYPLSVVLMIGISWLQSSIYRRGMK